MRGLKPTRPSAARDAGARTLADLARVADLSRQTLEFLAEADAFRSLGMDRRAALWAVKGMAPERRAEADAPLLALMGAAGRGGGGPAGDGALAPRRRGLPHRRPVAQSPSLPLLPAPARPSLGAVTAASAARR